jgi:hypothetical protein
MHACFVLHEIAQACQLVLLDVLRQLCLGDRCCRYIRFAATLVCRQYVRMMYALVMLKNRKQVADISSSLLSPAKGICASSADGVYACVNAHANACMHTHERIRGLKVTCTCKFSLLFHGEMINESLCAGVHHELESKFMSQSLSALIYHMQVFPTDRFFYLIWMPCSTEIENARACLHRFR